jgi:endonuclease-3
MPAKKAVSKKPAKKSGLNAALAKPAKSTTKPKDKFDSKRDLAPERVTEILKRLAATYPNAECALHHRNAWELLVATILSAQCTDVRVNMVTPELFRQFPTPKAMSEASQVTIEELIRSTGFYRNKAKSILGAAKKITEDFGGKVPRTLVELTTVPGAARKTANVVLGVAFGLAEGIVVDTHVLRISKRLHLTQATEPKKVEQDLVKIIPHDHWIAYSHEIIHHGRQICIARKPKCADCTLETLCTSGDKTWSSH